MTLPTTRHRAALAVATLALTGAVGATATTTAPPAHATPVTLKIVQHNTDQKPARWAKLVAIAETGKWDAVTAQEVCEGWVLDLRAKHPTWKVAYHEQTTNDRCPNGKGNVSISPTGGSEHTEAFAVPGEGKTFGIACTAFSKAGRRVHACSTHFTVYDDNPKEIRLKQARRVKEITAQWIGDSHAVVLGGDLNTSPTAKALNPIYQYPSGRSSGRFVEAEQLRLGTRERVGRDTVKGRKIDYVFFSTNRTPLSAGGTLRLDPVANEDAHQILKATTTIR